MKNIIVFFLYFISILLSACDNFLDKNSSNTLAIPSSFSDLQKLLDNEFDVNQFYPAQLEASTDNYYLTDQGFAGLRDIYQSMYIWEDNGMNEANWAQPYKAITIANVVLESLERIKNEKIDLRNKLEGDVYFGDTGPEISLSLGQLFR